MRREYREIAERILGRKLLSDEHVHHIDGNHDNNDPNNLQVLTKAQHTSIHFKGKSKSKKQIEMMRSRMLGNSYYSDYVKRNGSKARARITAENKRRWESGVFDGLRSRANAESHLRKLFRKYLPQVHWTTVETRMTQSGVPDLHGCWEGSSFWLELKLARGWEVALRPMQIGWITRQVRCGGAVAMAVRKGDELWLVRGAYAKRARMRGLRKLPKAAVMGRWSGGPARWPWPRILLALIRHRHAP